MARLHDKVIIITGAAQGMGATHAYVLKQVPKWYSPILTLKKAKP